LLIHLTYIVINQHIKPQNLRLNTTITAVIPFLKLFFKNIFVSIKTTPIMEEIVFKALIFKTKNIEIESFINDVIDTNKDLNITRDDLKNSILKLVLYKFIKVKSTLPKGNYIYKERNFFKAREVGSVHLWLEKQRNKGI